ncbi:transposable element Tcb2 transposase [Trichonephila clavipes]|uniref:Transposable element Tcb2 transposase n=1 Tax=Trichonephila clavipes TaxID=2585209 RepID=A0A8X6VCB7_TRICX|nr:transposable element Tcb2 transposase [Trichonephila clavipes]
MDGNARSHQTLAVEELLESEDITRMDWPSVLPRFKTHRTCVGCFGETYCSTRLHHPENTQQLKQMLIEECVLLLQEVLHQLVLSMRRRCKATIANVYPAAEDNILYQGHTTLHAPSIPPRKLFESIDKPNDLKTSFGNLKNRVSSKNKCSAYYRFQDFGIISSKKMVLYVFHEL